MKLPPALLLCAALALLSQDALAGDWPAFKHDAARSSCTEEALALPLAPAWTWQSLQPPQPAWGEPGRSLNALDFDYAFQPVVAGGIVVFASSADDTVRALDAATGTPRWQYTCGAPVRLAPQIDGGCCYFAGDDGMACCLDAKTGAEIWRVRLALNGQRVIANGRLASRWPCRSGVLVRGGTVFVTAGMWPSEGVYIFALDAATGRERWCNDTACYDYIEYPHEPSASFGGPAPQGALLANDDVLLVPTGRGIPAGFDAKTGRLLHYRADSGVGHKGGTWATLVGGTFFVSAIGWQPDIPPRLGESVEHFADSLAAFDARSGKEEWSLAAAMKAAAPEWKAAKWRGQIGAGLLGRTRAVFGKDRVFAFGNGRADAWNLAGGKVTALWSQAQPRVYAEALAANALLLGMDGAVTTLDPATGRELWRANVEGQARGVAIADGRAFVSTTSGALHVFGGVKSGAVVTTGAPSRAAESVKLPANVESALRQVGTSRGFALVLGGADARLAQGIAERTEFHVISVLRDAKAVAAERTRLLAETALYGSRVSVQSLDAADLPQFFAVLVVISGDAAGAAPAEWFRVLRPYGGVLSAAEGALAIPLGVARDEVRGGMVVRGKLPGAFDWDGKVEADERVKWPLEFAWWGGPSSQLQKARHTRPRTPLPANGRLFVFGEDTVAAVDAYSGEELWRRRLNSTIGVDAPALANDDSFYVVSGAAVAHFDAATGRLVEVFGEKVAPPPILDATKPLHIDGAQRAGASCAIDIESSATALRLVLTAQSKDPQRDDAWELAFDFRAAAQRVNAPGPGAFEIVVSAWDGVLRAQPTRPHPRPFVEKLSDGRVAVSFAWVDLEKLAGARPTDFALAADCKLWNSRLDLTLWDRPLTNARAKSFNDAEAIIVVAGSVPKHDAAAFSPYLAVPVRPLAQSPLKPARGESHSLPLLSLRRPKADLSDFAAGGVKPDSEKEAKMTFLPRARGFELTTRTEPFSAASGLRDYTPSYGCSGIISSATADFMRSGCIGVYDRADDSGMRNISGIRSGCGQTILPALGMLLYAEGTGNCLCTYNYATSFGMAPAPRRRNEDWALFNEQQAASSALRRIAFNLGAPGDRRDEQGTLWLALPRPQLGVKLGDAIAMPASFDVAEGFGPERINTDRHPIAGTDAPWLYGSNVRGLRRLHLDLQYYKPGGVCLSIAATAPKIDGELGDACWAGFGGTPVRNEATMWMRHDAENLYVASVPRAAAKAAPFAITLGDAGARVLVCVALPGRQVEVKRITVPAFDRHADVRTLDDVVTAAAELPGAVGATKSATELAIPWRALEALGLKRENLRASPNTAAFFGHKPPDVARNFLRSSFAIEPLAAAPAAAHYTVRLHFAEIDGAAPGERVFDVLLNGRPAATALDIAREAGGPMRALVREFRGLACGASLDVELREKSSKLTPASAPLLSAIEVLREDAAR